MATVYFLGAGASAADGLPLTGALNYGVGHWLNEREQAPELRSFYRDLFGLRDSGFRRAGRYWKAFLDSRDHGQLPSPGILPDLIETLSLMDLGLAEGHSFGMSSLRERRRLVEMDAEFLAKARSQLTNAIALSVKQATDRHKAPLTDLLVDRLDQHDVLVSTNWDVLPERRLVHAWRKRKKENAGERRQSPIKYHCVGERPVDWRGNDLDGVMENARPLLRLHGGLNWLGCSCCATIYVNIEWSFALDKANRLKDYHECHCGAGLSNIMIVPSYLKNYNSVGLRSVWREAQKRLERADRWVFIGYSLPSDDFHIRALLLRALRSRAAMRSPAMPVPHIEVYLDARGTAAKARYEDLFRLATPEVSLEGFSAWAKRHANDGSAS